MEVVAGIIVVFIIWSFRKSVTVWSSTAELVSHSKAREVAVNTAKTNIHTTKEVRSLIEEDPSGMDLEYVDAFLFEGRRPKASTTE